MKRNLNQKLIALIEYYNLINANFLLSNSPIKRTNTNILNTLVGSKIEKLNKLKKKIQSIKSCDLKKNATNLVFGDGNINSKIMIIGEGPGAQEDEQGKQITFNNQKTLIEPCLIAGYNLSVEKTYKIFNGK